MKVIRDGNLEISRVDWLVNVDETRTQKNTWITDYQVSTSSSEIE